MNNTVELKRHTIREKALQALFPLAFQEELTKQDAIRYALEHDVAELNDEETEFVPAYLDLLVEGVCAKQSELDGLIESHLKGWTLARIAKTDLVIMRIGLFEMLYVEDVPGKVAVNEAIELAKKFSDDASRKFINGVLSAILNEQTK